MSIGSNKWELMTLEPKIDHMTPTTRIRGHPPLQAASGGDDIHPGRAFLVNLKPQYGFFSMNTAFRIRSWSTILLHSHLREVASVVMVRWVDG